MPGSSGCLKLAKSIEAYEPQPDPLAEKMKELELQKVMMEIEKLKSEIELNKAKAMKEGVNAEKGLLDAVEQETGTKHLREIEKQDGPVHGGTRT